MDFFQRELIANYNLTRERLEEEKRLL